MNELRCVKIYTDGSCSGNPGPGGYGVIVTYGDKCLEMSRGYRQTTNNRMELMAAIVGLKILRHKCHVTVYTDSKYVADSVTKGWAIGWRANGWRTTTGKAANTDLWGQLLDLCGQHEVRFKWVKGHAGHPENERCDALANLAAQGNNLPADEMYETENP